MEGDSLVPVFVYPTELEFVVSGPSAEYRRVLTIYNPYDYAFSYKILCTAPEHYIVHEAEGIVQTRFSKDITIRAKPSVQLGMTHKLRVEIKKINSSEVLGMKVLRMAIVAIGRTPSEEDPSTFHRMPASSRSPEVTVTGDRPVGDHSAVLWLVVGGCLLALALPVHGDTDSVVPVQLHLSVIQKIIAGFILGVCTTLILSPTHTRYR